MTLLHVPDGEEGEGGSLPPPFPSPSAFNSSNAIYIYIYIYIIFFQGHFIKSLLFPPRHVSCEKARWRAVQEPTVPGLSVYNDPRSHKPLPSQWITFSNSTHSKFIYFYNSYVHTHSHTHTHTHLDCPSVVTQKVQPVKKKKKMQSQVLQLALKCTVQRHACPPHHLPPPLCLSWTAASMLTLLSANALLCLYGSLMCT